MAIIYLDQNKWIALAASLQEGSEDTETLAIAGRLGAAVNSGRVLVPLTSANIYETHKINDPDRRRRIASLQVSLSKGRVFRTRRDRLKVELSAFLKEAAGLPSVQPQENWFLSQMFVDAFAPRASLPLPNSLLDLMGAHPEEALFAYLTETPDETRRQAVERMSDSVEELRQRVETRRTRDKSESAGMKKRIYSANLIVEDLDLILEVATEAGAPWRSISEIGGPIVRRICREVPAYHAEVELAAKLESQVRPITENDFRDMQAFSTALPYANVVIGEKQFVNLALQCQLPERYQTKVSTDLRALWPHVTEPK
ncbi:MAG: hypothetical protein Q7T08_01195 [Devosia sp.]|nr:hypothetical protein [Devosia sp.]